ncbi:type VI secretion system membrane subunit TssM, partial [Pseudomonas syringae]
AVATFGKTTLDTYLMLSKAQREQADPAVLKARIPDYWYPAIYKQVQRDTNVSAQAAGEVDDYQFAGRQIAFYSDQIRELDVPRILNNAFLISSSRNYINSLLSQSLRAIE